MEPDYYSIISTTSSGLCDGEVKFLIDDADSYLSVEYYEDKATIPFFVKLVEIVSDIVPVDSSQSR